MQKDFKSMLSIDPLDYNKVFDKIEHSHSICDVEADLRFKFLKFDPNGEPQIQLLFDILCRHLADYCLKAQRHTNDYRIGIDRYREAKSLLRYYEKSGELGEIILWFLMENILEAPQILAKMNLKTNPNLEANGSDGVHAKVIDGVLNIFFGEAKLYGDLSQALSSAFESIKYFHDKKIYNHEYKLVTSHFKYLDIKSKSMILDYIKNEINVGQVKIRHACLIGYDWQEYKKLHTHERKNFIKDFKTLYLGDTQRIVELIQTRFEKFEYKHLCFDMFLIPFESVDKLRRDFLDAL